MKRNVIIICIALILVLTLSSCLQSEFDSKHYAKTSMYGIALSMLKNEDMPRPKENERWIRSLKINYPQLYNLEDADKEMRINKILFQQALNIRDVIDELTYIEYHIDYEIKFADDGIVSVFFYGFCKDWARGNRLVSAITINIVEERLMNLSDFFDVEEDFIEKHLHKDFNVIENNFEHLWENDQFVEEYIKDYASENHEYDFYVRGDTIGIIVPIPTPMGYLLLEN